jgi:hypothetical protein
MTKREQKLVGIISGALVIIVVFGCLFAVFMSNLSK